mmetsp:Transcript_40868/g.107292  ORF Transcript_40868/g.107292 Transcript_40868/m.107292 type:complete len:317 (-) Transcript_40868:139-1089(-)
MVAKNYYEILGIPRTAGEGDIKHGYRKLAMKWHPQRNPDQSAVAQEKFRDIAEAFDVLSDPGRRATFDQFGEEGLKTGVASLKATFRGYQYTGDPYALFNEFFGSKSPFAEVVRENGVLSDDFVMRPLEIPKKKEDPLVVDFEVTLEELFVGAKKQISVSRTRLLPDRRTTGPNDKVLTVSLVAGWRDGTKITFAGEGNETHPQIAPGDLVLVLKQVPHARFVREVNDLVFTTKVALVDALCGHNVSIETLEGKTLSIPVPEVSNPKHEKRLPGRGMPSSSGGAPGDLVIRFDIQFPNALSTSEKASMESVLRKYA